MSLHPKRHSPVTHRYAQAIFALLTLFACLALAACGGSSSSSSSSVSKSSTTSASNPGGAGSNRFATLRSCLAKEGITLPSQPGGTRPPSGSGSPGGAGGPAGGAGGFQLPKGVTAAQFQAAIKKCGGGNFPGGGPARSGTAASKTALTKFATCMRENGINLPTPNSSGKGPVFNTKGINTNSSAFQSAQRKCQVDLEGTPGGSGGPPNGTPPSGGSPPAGEAGAAPPSSEAPGE